MRHKNMLFRMISLTLLVVLLSSTAVFGAEVPKDKYTLTFQKVGTVKETVTLPDYNINGQEIEMVLIPKGSDITFTPAVMMGAAVSGLEKADGIFMDTYDGVPWVIDGEKSLVTGVDAGKKAIGTLGYYEYYLFNIYDDNDNVTRIIFKLVDGGSVETTPEEPSESADAPDAWAKAEVERAISLKLVPDQIQNQYKNNISRSDFCRLAVNMIEIKTGKSADTILSEKGIAISDNPFADTTEPFIINANALGIVNGKGNGTFDPSGSITRQEAAVMLTNAAKVLNQQVVVGEVAFSDSSAIANWAKQSVSYVASAGVMNGTGNNSFSPKENYSKQQAMMTIVRLFDSVKQTG